MSSPSMDEKPERKSDFESKIGDWQAYIERVNRSGGGAAGNAMATGESAETHDVGSAGDAENRPNNTSTKEPAGGAFGDSEDGSPANAAACESIKDDMIDAPVIEDADIEMQASAFFAEDGPREQDLENGGADPPHSGTSPRKSTSRFIEIKSPTRFIGSQSLGSMQDACATSPKQYKYRRISFGSEELLQDTASAGAPSKPLSGFAQVCRGTPRPIAADLDAMKASFVGKASVELSPGGKGAWSAANQYMNGTIPSDVSQEVLDYMETKIKLQNVQIEAYKENIRRLEEKIGGLQQELQLAWAGIDAPGPAVVRQFAGRGLQLVREMRDAPRPADLTAELTREKLTVESLKNVIQELLHKIEALRKE